MFGLLHALQSLLVLGIIGFVAVAGLSLWLTHPPEVPAFARRQPTSSSPQLRQDPNAGVISGRGFLFRKRYWFVGTCCPPVRLDANQLVAMRNTQHARPVSVTRNRTRRWWWFEDAFYWESAGYTDKDVLALVRDRERKAKRRLERAHTVLNAEQSLQRRRESIPRELRRAVFQRDGGRCRQCGADFDLQYDHILPFAKGGATTFENLQLLCGDCNREKGADI